MEEGVRKSDSKARDAVAAPRKQRGPVAMIHMTVCSFANGVVLEPHVVPDDTTATSEYYVANILSADGFPEIQAAVQMAEEANAARARMEDLASPHTARNAMRPLAKEKARQLPWVPIGADANPLGIFVWGKHARGIEGSQGIQRRPRQAQGNTHGGRR